MRRQEETIFGVSLAVLVLLLVFVPKSPSGIAYAVLIAAFVYGAGIAAFIRHWEQESTQ